MLHQDGEAGQTSVTALGGPPQPATSLRWHMALGLAALAAVQSTVALVQAEQTASSNSRRDGSPVDDDVLVTAQPYRCAAASMPSGSMSSSRARAAPSTVAFQWGPDFADSVCNSLCGGLPPAHLEEASSSKTEGDGTEGSARPLHAAEIAALALVTGMSLMGCAYSVKLLCRKK